MTGKLYYLIEQHSICRNGIAAANRPVQPKRGSSLPTLLLPSPSQLDVHIVQSDAALD